MWYNAQCWSIKCCFEEETSDLSLKIDQHYGKNNAENIFIDLDALQESLPDTPSIACLVVCIYNLSPCISTFLSLYFCVTMCKHHRFRKKEKRRHFKAFFITFNNEILGLAFL